MYRCTLNTGASNFPTYLSGFGRRLDKRYSVASSQLLCLPRLHHAGAQVALIPHQHHGNTVTVLHPVDLLSETHVTEEVLVTPKVDKSVEDIFATFTFFFSTALMTPKNL